MPKFHGIAGPDSTPVYPSVRKIGPADLKDALAKGVEDFLTMPSSLVFLGLIYPIVGIGLVAGSSLPLLFPLMSGFALVGPFATIGLYEISRRRELGLDTSWAHAFGVSRSHSIFSILSLGLLLLAIFACWEFTAQSLYVALFGSTPPESFIQFVANILGTPQGWQLIGFGTAIGFVFAVVALSISVVSFPLLLDRDVDVPVAISRLTKATGRQNAAATGAALPSDLAPLPPPSARRSCARTALSSPGNNLAVGRPGPYARSHSQVLRHKPQIATCCCPPIGDSSQHPSC